MSPDLIMSLYQYRLVDVNQLDMSFGSIYIYIYIAVESTVSCYAYIPLLCSFISSSYFVNFGDEQAAEKQK